MKSVLIIGMGRFGKNLAKEMQRLGNDVMIIDRDASLIADLAPIAICALPVLRRFHSS